MDQRVVVGRDLLLLAEAVQREHLGRPPPLLRFDVPVPGRHLPGGQCELQATLEAAPVATEDPAEEVGHAEFWFASLSNRVRLFRKRCAEWLRLPRIGPTRAWDVGGPARSPRQ